jgi:hypothetical protein
MTEGDGAWAPESVPIQHAVRDSEFMVERALGALLKR